MSTSEIQSETKFMMRNKVIGEGIGVIVLNKKKNRL
jgi:hypothetical protein